MGKHCIVARRLGGTVLVLAIGAALPQCAGSRALSTGEDASVAHNDAALDETSHVDASNGGAPNDTGHLVDAGSGLELDARAPAPDDRDLRIELACGFHSADVAIYSGFVGEGETCQVSALLNTFALRLTGTDRARYSAVVRCGYIRYDNGTFVGERVAVEARDGQWCHDAALQHIQLADRMLLTDVSFAIEATDATAPNRDLSVQFLTRAEWTQVVPAEKNLCAYVAHRQYGTYACSMVPPASYCLCPSGTAWEDFFKAVRLYIGTP